MAIIDRERIRVLVKASGKSAAIVSRAAGLGETAIKDILNGRSRSPGVETLSAIADVLQVPVAEFFAGMEAVSPADRPVRLRPVLRRIPVMGEVAAGVWRETVPREASDAIEFLQMDVAGYETAQLYALKVVGDSMNLHYAPGRYVIVAPAAEAGVRRGDHVVVERAERGRVEITIKELVQENGTTALWPRSTNPDHKPLYLTGDHAEQTKPRIIGIVIADYNRRQRPDMMFEPGPETWAE